MHNHEHCNHKLAYCQICDVAYCEKCGKEWGSKYYYYPYRWNTYTVTYDYSSDNTGNNVHTHIQE